MEKPYLNGTIKLDESALQKAFVYNLNKINPVLLQLDEQLPCMAEESCYGDLQNAITELSTEVKNQINRVDTIFKKLRVIPNGKICTNMDFRLRALFPDKNNYLLDNLSKDLYLVFHIQEILSIKRNYYSILRSIAGSLNSIDINQYLQYSYDECEDNQNVFKMIAKEYMESSINTYLN